MKTRRLPLAAALSAALALLSTPASSAALGEIVAVSPLGEPFRVEIAIAAGTIEDAANCLRVVVPDDRTADLPWLKGGRISVSGRGSHARIIVTSARPVNEPALKLAISDVCSTLMRKEYTLLLPYPATTTRAPAAAPQWAAPGGRPGNTRTWTTAAGESLATLAEALYPDNASARRRFVRATAEANPLLFPDDASRTATLEPGTPVLIPDLRRAAAPRPDREPASKARATRQPSPSKPPRTTPPVAAAAAPQSPAPSGARTDRLVVADEAARTGGAPGVVGDAGLSPTTRGVDASWSTRERELAAAVDRSIIAEMELLARIKELEQIQARLQEQAETLVASLPAATAPQAARPSPAPAPVPVPVPPRTVETHQDWYLAGALLLGILLILAGLLRKRRGVEPRANTQRQHASAPPLAATPQAPSEQPKAAPAAPAPRPTNGEALPQQHTLIPWDSASRLPEGAKIVMTETGGEVVEEHKSAIELAEIMMSFGRVRGAADTLAEFIQSNPKQAITPWLKLLDVYKAAGLRAEFDGLAYQLNKTFNVRSVTWDTYDNSRAIPLSLEDLPHIAAHLQGNWRTRECQAFIQQLLRDNRGGAREGFPFAIIDELLLLEAVLEDELGSYRSYAASRTESGH